MGFLDWFKSNETNRAELEEELSSFKSTISNKTLQDLLEILPKEVRYQALIDTTWGHLSPSIANDWIENHETSFVELKQILERVNGTYRVQLGEEDENDYHTINRRFETLGTWIKEPSSNLTGPDLIELTQLIPEQKQALLLAWIKINSPSLDDLAAVIREGNFQRTQNVNQCYLMSIEDTEARYNALAEMAKDNQFNSLYDTVSIANAYNNCMLPADNVIALSQALYPNNETYQAKLFLDVYSQVRSADLPQIELSHVENFISALHDDNIVQEILSNVSTISPHLLNPDGYVVKQQPILQTDAQKLDLLGGRTATLYHSLTDALKRPIKDALTEDGMTSITMKFPDKNLAALPLGHLFAFYIFNHDVDGFRNIIKPEVLEDIKQQFSPSEHDIHISQSEHSKIEALIETSLPAMSALTNYLKTKVPDTIPTPSDINTYEINFTNSIIPTEKHAQLNTQFRTLLAPGNATRDNVARFFEELLGLDHQIEGTNARGDDKKGLLFDAFVNFRQELSHLFTQEGRVDSIIETVASISDGCAANIGTQMRIAINKSFMSDPSDQILYDFFIAQIAMPLFNRGDDHLGGTIDGVDVLNNHHINSTFISPNGLIEAMKKQFYDDGQHIFDPWELIEHEMGAVKKGILLNLLDSDLSKLDENAAELATYTLLQRTLDIVVDSPYTTAFKEKYQELTEQAQDPANIEAQIHSDIEGSRFHNSSTIAALDLATTLSPPQNTATDQSWTQKMASEPPSKESQRKPTKYSLNFLEERVPTEKTGQQSRSKEL